MNESAIKSTNEEVVLGCEEKPKSRVQDKESGNDTKTKRTDKSKKLSISREYTIKTNKRRKRTKKEDGNDDKDSNKVNNETTKSKSRKKKKYKKETKKRKVRPILESVYKEKIKYLTKRIYHCRNEDKIKSYQANIDKLDKLVKINC